MEQEKQPTNQKIMEALNKGFNDLKKEDQRILKSVLNFAEITEERFNKLKKGQEKLTQSQERIELRLDEQAYKCDLNELENRVEKIEVKI